MGIKHVEFKTVDDLCEAFGPQDKYLSKIEKAFDITVRAKDANVEINGEESNVKMGEDTILTIKKIIEDKNPVTGWVVDQAIDYAKHGKGMEAAEAMTDAIAFTHRGKPITCKTLRQKQYVDAINNSTITFCIGPAGTGKTYLAIALAVAALKRKEIAKIIVTRPAVEAGEKLGFLPGDLQEKVDPYLTPLYDALAEFLGEDKFAKLEERGVIEAAPLAFMRGRTLKDSFIVLDEAQNCTIPQMKMFLTRLGENSRMVVTGDVTQTDLPYKEKSGLKHAVDILKDIDGISISKFTRDDVIRHPLVQKIIDAYDKA